MKLVERTAAVTVGAAHKVEVLAHQYWGADFLGIPQCRIDDVLDRDQSRSAVALLVDEDLGGAGVEGVVTKQKCRWRNGRPSLPPGGR